MALMRLHKWMADQGVASRRKCEEYIREGLVKVNGEKIIEMGVKIDPLKDSVTLHSSIKIHEQNKEWVYIMLNKPCGYVSTVTGKEKPSVMELLRGVSCRVFPVGRLDKETEGLLLFTNDGRFAYEMTHPSFEKEKEYEVTVMMPIPEGSLKKLRDGVNLNGKKTLPATVRRLAPSRFRIILKEGRNRQIRRMCQKVGYSVKTLKRLRIGKLWLKELPIGKWRYITRVTI